MKFNIVTLGCKVNAYESESIKELLANASYKYTDDLSEAQIIILNTCSVTSNADQKSLKMVRHLKRINDGAFFIVCGCSVQNNPNRYENMGIDIIIGNNEKSKIPEMLNNKIKTYENTCNMQLVPFETMQINSFNHVRAYLKIQDGCENYCTYCIIPYLRGKERCKNYQDVINETNNLVQNGFQEIVLTGINTGTYYSENHSLVDLINELSKITGLKRIRLSSIEITQLKSDFMELLKNNKVLCDNLHIPLQAGSDEVLKMMNRKYDLAYFENTIKEIRKIRPNIYLSTDCLVGFPGETAEMFLHTLEFCKRINFSKIHVFPYSKRTGTPAARMPNQVDDNIKKDRVNSLINLSKELEEAYYDKFIGTFQSVLIEETKADYSVGHTPNMLKLKIPQEIKLNTIINLKIERQYYEDDNREN